MDGSTPIEAEGLRKTYGDVVALAGVDLRAEAGTVLGLLGPNGAGKTTAVRILTTLLPPDAGTARVAGFDVVADASKLRSQIGLAGQYAAVDENLTGEENLTMVGRLYHFSRAESKKRSLELLERFDLSEAADRLVKTYSGGMRRRLDLAAALVARPPVIFLDEPTTGLDPRSRLALWEVIEDRVGGGTTVLLTTQYLDEADRLSDKIAVIDHGLVIAEGTSDELKDRVGGEKLEVTLCAGASVDAAVTALAPVSSDGAPVAENGIVSVPISGGTSITQAVRELDDAGVRIDDVAVRRPTLDDVFMTLTGKPPEPEEREDGTGEHEVREPEGGGAMTAIRLGFSDALVLAMRSLRRIPRQPDLLTAFTVQPIMFVLLFVYVFGGAISVPPIYGDYTQFLMPGIMVQTIAFGGFVTALGIAEDLNKGLIDRFRSLPMARSAVLTGRTIADIATNLLSLVVMTAVGLLVGFSFTTSAPEVAGGFLLLLLIGYTFSWIFAWVGLNSGSPETANALGFMLIFPLTFLSSAFVPPESMPDALEFFATDINPFTTMVDATRALFVGSPAGNDIWGSVLWCVGLIALFSFLSARSYSRAIRS